jgi:hypothetical protein
LPRRAGKDCRANRRDGVTIRMLLRHTVRLRSMWPMVHVAQKCAAVLGNDMHKNRDLKRFD